MSEIELPALPPSQMNVDVWDSEVRGLHGANAAYYSADQLRDFARQAVLAERERCAKVCDSVNNHDNPMTANDCADEIRRFPK